jgi:hypothetical protein
MINTERNRALLTDLFTALGREGWVKCWSAPRVKCGEDARYDGALYSFGAAFSGHCCECNSIPAR